MYNQTVYNGLINIIPFWSSNLIQISGLGNEYNIVFNLILTELLKISTTTFNDTILIGITLIIAIAFIGYKYGYTFKINLFEKNVIQIVGKEMHNTTGSTVIYCDKILTINNYLLNVKKIKNITYVNDVDITINDMYNYQLTSKINLNIKRHNIARDDNSNTANVIYELSSYNSDIEKFISELSLTYKNSFISKITLIGDENDKIISYPEPIHAINYYVNSNFKFPNLKCMKVPNSEYNASNSTKSTKTDSNETLNNIKTNDMNNYSYTLDNIINFDLGKVFLTINRNNSQVMYYLTSTKINCKEWLDEIINEYNQNKNLKFKNKLTIMGREQIWTDNESFKKYYYSTPMWTINWLLIEKLNYQNYECVNGKENLLKYKYVLEPVELFKIQDDLFLTVEKEIINDNGNYLKNKYIKHNNTLNIVYTLYSNSLDIKKILENYVEQFEAFNNKLSINKIQYHFTYTGMHDNNLIFNSKILSEQNTENELFETFDKIYNEHVDFLKNDIDKLKNIEYYKSHGLKRKKGYLFHGTPGCGKTSSVVAMALYDSRHIIEIPFSLITSHQEFVKIMELKSINNIEINNNNIILLFDEIDIGMHKIGSRTNNDNKIVSQNSNESTNIIENVVKAMTVFDNDSSINTTNQKINLGSLLSKLDGIGNYNGLIIVGTTNYIEQLDPALYRELRLTPIKFDKLRKEDCVKIIQSYFGSNYNTELNDMLIDRKITPTKLIHLCHQYENIEIEKFFNNILIEHMK